MERKRVVVAGCRYYNERDKFNTFVDETLKIIGSDITILSGHCSGVDTMAEMYAEEHGMPVEIFKPDRKRYGRGGGPVRNKQMIESCDVVIAFWDGVSRGTRNLLDPAEKYNRRIFIFNINTEELQ